MKFIRSLKSFLSEIKFPHFYRLFPASNISMTELLLLWGTISILFLINVTAIFLQNQVVRQSIQMVLKNPYSPAAHIDLIPLFAQSDKTNQATTEQRIAQELSLPSGDTISFETSTAQSTDTSIASMKRQYEFWKNEVKDKPGYRDGHLMLSSLAYLLGDMTSSKTHAGLALSIDPRSSAARYLLARLEIH